MLVCKHMGSHFCIGHLVEALVHHALDLSSVAWNVLAANLMSGAAEPVNGEATFVSIDLLVDFVRYG